MNHCTSAQITPTARNHASPPTSTDENSLAVTKHPDGVLRPGTRPEYGERTHGRESRPRSSVPAPAHALAHRGDTGQARAPPQAQDRALIQQGTDGCTQPAHPRTVSPFHRPPLAPPPTRQQVRNRRARTESTNPQSKQDRLHKLCPDDQQRKHLDGPQRVQRRALAYGPFG